MVDAVTGTTTTTTTTGSNPLASSSPTDTSAAISKLDTDFSSFLKLLTVQLQNQDPTTPLDTNQLTSQITQFSQVEQQINTNKSLNKILAQQQTNSVNSAVSYIDRFVQYTGNEFQQRTGGTPILSYNLPAQASSVTVAITDESGRVIYMKDVTAGGNSATVEHAIAWDGKDSSGNIVATGKYKVNITAKDTNGKDITATTTVTDLVTEVAMVDGEVQLSLGDVKVPASSVKSIKGLYASVNTPASNGSTTNTAATG